MLRWHSGGLAAGCRQLWGKTFWVNVSLTVKYPSIIRTHPAIGPCDLNRVFRTSSLCCTLTLLRTVSALSALQHAIVPSPCPLRLPTLDSQPWLDPPLTSPYPQSSFDDIYIMCCVPKRCQTIISTHYLRILSSKAYLGSKLLGDAAGLPLALDISPSFHKHLPLQFPIFLSTQLAVIAKL